MLGFIIRSYKYLGRDEWEPILADWLVKAITTAPWFDRVEAIVAVPTHWKHRLGRPFYAAEVLAAAVAKRTLLPMALVLRRVRAGPHQIGLSYMERLNNVRGAFSLRRGAALKDARILLIDDVRTTGATTEECAKVLRRSGAAEVYSAVVVTAGWPGPSAPLPEGA